MTTPDHEDALAAEGPYDLGLTLRWLRLGARDPAWMRDGVHVVHASRTPDGPVTIRFTPRPGGVRLAMWGPGTAFAAERARRLTGLADDPSGFAPAHPWVAEQARRFEGPRHVQVVDPVEALWKVILQQRVTYEEAHRSWFGMLRAWGEPAPGPYERLRLAPEPARLARTPYEVFHPFGVEQKRATTLREVAARAGSIRAWCDDGHAVAGEKLALLPGIGPWTLGYLSGTYLGDADAVLLGDFHLPHTVAWALRRQPRSDDDEMLKLLEPFRPHRARVVRLLLHAGVSAPKRGQRRRNRWERGS